MYYFTLLFLLAFTTPVLITTSLNVYITSAVSSECSNSEKDNKCLTGMAGERVPPQIAG